MRSHARLLLALAMCSSACSVAPDVDLDAAPEDGVVVEEGKEDDFFSLSAREFIVSGRTTVTLEEELADADDATKLARVQELIGLKQTAIAWFLTQYIIDKEHDAANASYGGFGAMAKNASFNQLDIQPVDARTYSFKFEQLIAGRNDLMEILPLISGDSDHDYFVLTVGKPSNDELARLETNHKWYRSAPWSDWNPDNVDDSRKEDMRLSIGVERDSSDAWFDYAALFEDGELSIDVHFGWDYHGNYHVRHAETMFRWLGERSFQKPVARFEDLSRTSGAFTRKIKANGREIQIAVRLFYGKPGSDTDPDTDEGGRALEADMRASLGASDVIIYSGHSGPLYGFALGNWRMTEEGDFDDSEMSTVQMPFERYQVVVAEGCDTYMIGGAFRANPAKPDGRYIDIITTTSFSNATSPATVQSVIDRLIETDSRGHHRPRTVKSLLTDLDTNSAGHFHTMYGIHGIDDSPHQHPYGEVANLCEECDVNADCGGVGNSCVTIGGAGKRCVVACTDDSGCPDGYACRSIASGASSTIYDQACVPRSMSCGG